MFKKLPCFIHSSVYAFVLPKDSQLYSFHKTALNMDHQPVLKYLSFVFLTNGLNVSWLLNNLPYYTTA